MRHDIEAALVEIANTYPIAGEIGGLIFMVVMVAMFGFLAFILADSVRSGLESVRAWMAHDDSDGWM